MPLDLHDLLLLASVPGVGPHRLRALLDRIPDPRAILLSGARELLSVPGIDRRTALSIAQYMRSPLCGQASRRVEHQLVRLSRIHGCIVTLWDDAYPTNLRGIYDPPPILFVRGTLSPNDAHSIAIVGTRTPSAYGIETTSRFASGLSGLGLPVVSGLARGIDTIAHRSTLAGGGRTLAVIGSGIDIIYPPENAPLAERVIGNGAVLSELEMGAKPDAGNFPRRNRIISGIAMATLIVETGIDGGAMITATTAFDQDREIFAIPTSISEKRRSGTNLLIKQGKALLVECVDDIVAELAIRLKGVISTLAPPVPEPIPPMTLFERNVYDVLSETPLHVDLLAERAGTSTSDALVHLLSLEFKGLIRQLPGKMFVRT